MPINAVRLTRRTMFAFAIATLGAHISAKGQTTAPSQSAATTQPSQLPPVIVVAQKQPAPQQSLPTSITAVTSETLKDGAIQTINEAAIYAPNTFINQFTAQAVSNPFFRGIGGSPLNPGVTTFIDGVPQLNSYSSNVQLIDVNQVEFVRGPQARCSAETPPPG